MRKVNSTKSILILFAKLLLVFVMLGAGYLSGNMVRKYYEIYKDSKLVEKNELINNLTEVENKNELNDITQTIVVGNDELVVPNYNATDSEKGTFSVKMMELAQETDQMMLKNCELTPAVVKRNIDSKITIINNDPVEHNLRIDQLEWKIPPNSTGNFDLMFKNGAGLYGLSCKDKLAGMVYVLE